MEILVCNFCRGSGRDYRKQTSKPEDRCPECGGTGIPRNYTPPTVEEVIRWLDSSKKE
jgi:DnaJ-class molecular chaperone